VAARDVAKLHRFVVDNPGALSVRVHGKLGCLFYGALPIIDHHAIEIVDDDTLPADSAEIRRHPNPKFWGPGHVVCTDTSIEILDVLCFDSDDHLTRSSDPLIGAIADTLAGNVSIKKVEIGAFTAFGTADALASSERRATVVRARLIAAGIAPARLVATG